VVPNGVFNQQLQDFALPARNSLFLVVDSAGPTASGRSSGAASSIAQPSQAKIKNDL